MLDEGVWAEVKVGNEHLRLFAEHNAQGVQASAYNVISKTWIAPSESVVDLEEGKERAEVHAREYLKRVANVELPALRWKSSLSLRARIDSPAVHMHRAGSILPVVAVFLRSEEPEIFSRRIQQRNAWLDLQMLYCAVDFQRNFHRAFGVLSFICDERFGGWRSSMK